MKSVHYLLTPRLIVATAAIFTVVGCAGAPAPRAKLGAAEQAVMQARAAQAAEYAPLELRTSEEKLAEARAAVERNDYESSRRLAEAARVDAELAAAIAQRDRGKAAVNEVQQSLEALREQIRVTGGNTGAPSPGAARQRPPSSTQ